MVGIWSYLWNRFHTSCMNPRWTFYGEHRFKARSFSSRKTLRSASFVRLKVQLHSRRVKLLAMKYIRVASKLARVVKEINLAIFTLKIDNKFLKSPIITEMSEFAFFNFNNIPTRSNPVKIHLNLPAFCSSIF